MLELFVDAVTGYNLIPTVLLGLVLLYWFIAIIGAFDFDFFDFDLDLDGADAGPFYAILAFLHVAELPFMLVFSVLILIFWMITMIMYYYIPLGGLIGGLLLIAYLIISVILTKYVTLPLRGLFRYSNMQDDRGNQVVEQLCTLMCQVTGNRLGQAEIERDGASIVINVKSEYDNEAFEKNEVAYVSRKDTEKNVYYIVKIKE